MPQITHEARREERKYRHRGEERGRRKRNGIGGEGGRKKMRFKITTHFLQLKTNDREDVPLAAPCRDKQTR